MSLFGIWCGMYGYVSHFNFDFDAVKSNWVNNNLVYLRIDKVDPSMNAIIEAQIKFLNFKFPQFYLGS